MPVPGTDVGSSRRRSFHAPTQADAVIGRNHIEKAERVTSQPPALLISANPRVLNRESRQGTLRCLSNHHTFDLELKHPTAIALRCNRHIRESRLVFVE